MGDGTMTCKLCAGTGALTCLQGGEREWWDCPAGVRVVFGPARLGSGGRKLGKEVAL